MNIAIVRGKFLNAYEMQFYEPLVKNFSLTGFGSLTSYHDNFRFPVKKLASPMDLPEFPYKMPILNRLFIDAHYLFGLEPSLKGFDIAHTAETYYHYTQQCLNAKKYGYVKKVVATVLENIPFNNEGILGRKAFKERARKELDHIIALTKKTREALLAEGADPQRISVISHFIDTKHFYPAVDYMKRQNKKAITILFTGRLEEYKGVLDIFQAFCELKKDAQIKSHVFTLKFVGDGSLHQTLQKKITSERLKEFVSVEKAPYDHMPKVYRNADIFVAPSKARVVKKQGQNITTWEEQYCTTLLEAQASGLPIVTTTSGGIPENIGDAGIMVQPGDTQALSFSLKQLILDPDLRTKYSQKARNRAETVHDITVGAKKLKELYLSLK